jgi:hypothetical protein
MSYNIIKTNGTPLATVADGQTNSTAASLTLIGKNYAGYGTFLNQNFIKLLENFSSATAPLYPLVGQLWWKSDTRLLQVYDKFGNWKTISGAQSQSDAPSNALVGDLWFDTVNLQLKTYSGASWIVIGPSFTATTGTSGAIADTVVDNSSYSHVVVKFFVQNNLIAILSKDATFTPGTRIVGFETIKPGFNLASDRVPALVYYDNANNASYLGGVVASKYILKTAPTFDAKVVVQNPDGIELQETNGTVSYFTMSVAGNNINLISKPRGYGFVFKTVPDSGGLEINALTIDRVTGLVSVSADPASALNVATKGYVDSGNAAINSRITTTSTTINNTINNLSATSAGWNANTRVIQSELGIATGVSLANSTQWNQIMASGQNFAANIVSLWSNVAAIHANVLSNPGVAPASTASMFSNVTLVQTTLAALGTSAVRRDGSASVQGVIVPDDVNTRDFGSAALRFRNVFANTANVASIVHSGTTGTGDIGQSALRFGTAYVSNVYAAYGSSFFDAIDKAGTSGVGDIGGSSSRFGTLYVTNINSTGGIGGDAALGTFSAINHGGTNGFGDIGSSSNRFGTIHCSNLVAHYGESTFTNNITVNALNREGRLVQALTGDIGAGRDGGASRFGTAFVTTANVTSIGKWNCPVSTTSGDIGADHSLGRFGTVYASTFDGTTFTGTATQARYADLAERYEADAVYAPGTVVTIGGTKEITMELVDASEDVFGVISTNPAHLMNSAAGSDETHPAVALTGRVPVRVIGSVRKGHRLVSAGHGCAREAAPGEATAFNVIGRALHDKAEAGEGLVEVTVQAK